MSVIGEVLVLLFSCLLLFASVCLSVCLCPCVRFYLTICTRVYRQNCWLSTIVCEHSVWTRDATRHQLRAEDPKLKVKPETEFSTFCIIGYVSDRTDRHTASEYEPELSSWQNCKAWDSLFRLLFAPASPLLSIFLLFLPLSFLSLSQFLSHLFLFRSPSQSGPLKSR